MLFLITLLSAFAAHAHATEECPDLSGHYRDRGPFLYEIRQTGCSELRWDTRDAPNSPNPPSEPGTDIFVIDCRKKGDFVRQESLCWNGPVLEQRAYGRNYTGRYVPISVRRLSLTETGALADRFFLTDETGEEKIFQDSLYERISR